jgi:hypothetical protein
MVRNSVYFEEAGETARRVMPDVKHSLGERRKC